MVYCREGRDRRQYTNEETRFAGSVGRVSSSLMARSDRKSVLSLVSPETRPKPPPRNSPSRRETISSPPELLLAAPSREIRGEEVPP